VYAIVDIETTGSHPAANGITEIAIILHDGTEVEGKYVTFINPKVPIPPFVSQLTGIYNYTVADAPYFEDVADKIYNLLKKRIFIAHNVNFDYTFIKHHLHAVGYDWQARKLCTVRLARAVFPGYPKYGLEHITKALGIENERAHRAEGDALATTTLFEMCKQKGGEAAIKEMLKKGNQEHILPPNLPKEQLKQLPQSPGVYYFKDVKGKVIYVGKAKQIKDRVISHFTGNDISKKRQDFLRKIFTIDYKETPTELTASILESVEIKRLWPAYNISQKRLEQQYGIYSFEDQNGYIRLAIDKKKQYLKPIISTGLYADAHRILWQMVKDFKLNPHLCFLSKIIINEPNGVQSYNLAVQNAINHFSAMRETFIIKEHNGVVNAYALMEEGSFYGMGIITNSQLKKAKTIDDIKQRLKQYPSNATIESMLYLFKERNPEKVIKFNRL